MPQLEQIAAIEKRLWKAADALRANSNYASNEYFLPGMGLVFLRHACSRFLSEDCAKAIIGAGLDLSYRPRPPAPAEARPRCDRSWSRPAM